MTAPTITIPPAVRLEQAVAFVVRDRLVTSGTTAAELAAAASIDPIRLTACLDGRAVFNVSEVGRAARALALNHAGVYRRAERIIEGGTLPTSAPLPPVTPCPVWCTAADAHPLEIDEEGYESGDRHHRLETGRISSSVVRYPAIVACEVYDTTADGQSPAVVEIADEVSAGVSFTSPEQVADLVAAVQRAASIAFPDDPGVAVRAAEQELLVAVGGWRNGRAPEGRVASAYDRLMVATVAATRTVAVR